MPKLDHAVSHAVTHLLGGKDNPLCTAVSPTGSWDHTRRKPLCLCQVTAGTLGTAHPVAQSHPLLGEAACSRLAWEFLLQQLIIPFLLWVSIRCLKVVKSAQRRLGFLWPHMSPSTTHLLHQMFTQAPWTWLEVEQLGRILWMRKWWCVHSSQATPECPTRSIDTAWNVEPGSCHTEELASLNVEGWQASSKSGHRGTSKVWQGEGGKATKGGCNTLCCLLEPRHLWHMDGKGEGILKW